MPCGGSAMERVGLVLHDVPVTERVARDVDRVVHEPRAMPTFAGGRAVRRQRVQQRPGQHSIGNEPARPVAVDEHCLQRLHALHCGIGQERELVGVEHERDGVEAPRVAHRTGGGGVSVSVGGERQLVHEVAGALRGEQTVGLTLAVDQHGCVERAECPGNRTPCRARLAVGVEQFVETAGDGRVGERSERHGTIIPQHARTCRTPPR